MNLRTPIRITIGPQKSSARFSLSKRNVRTNEKDPEVLDET